MTNFEWAKFQFLLKSFENNYIQVVLKNVLFTHHVLNIVEKSMYNTLYFVKLKHTG